MSKFLIMSLYSPRLIKKLEEDIKKNPQSRSFCSLARIYYKQGDIQRAKRLCLQGLKHSSSYSQAYILLAEIYYKENQLDEAVKLLNKAKELNPENPHIYKNLAQIYKKQKQPEKTLKAYKMLAFLSPNDSTAILSVQHLEKILRPPLVSSFDQQIELPKKESAREPSRPSALFKGQTLSKKQNLRLIKLNQILARVENHIEQMAKA